MPNVVTHGAATGYVKAIGLLGAETRRECHTHTIPHPGGPHFAAVVSVCSPPRFFSSIEVLGLVVLAGASGCVWVCVVSLVLRGNWGGGIAVRVWICRSRAGIFCSGSGAGINPPGITRKLRILPPGVSTSGVSLGVVWGFGLFGVLLNGEQSVQVWNICESAPAVVWCFVGCQVECGVAG